MRSRGDDQAFIRNVEEQWLMQNVFKRIPRTHRTTNPGDYTVHIILLDFPTTDGGTIRCQHRYGNN